jgi:bifunctional aspartokinase / homoserine dehydrogenase 1
MHLCYFITAVSVEQAEAAVDLPKGDMWSVHKFGGTCMGTAQRIKNVADIVLCDPSERKLVVVSAMSKVTDMMYNLVNKAQSRDDSYIAALDEVFEKHMAAANELLAGEDLARFLSQLHADISNLKAMLRAIYIGGAIKSVPLIFLYFLCDMPYFSNKVGFCGISIMINFYISTAMLNEN